MQFKKKKWEFQSLVAKLEDLLLSRSMYLFSLASALLVFLMSLFFVGNIQTHYSFSQFFPKSHPLLNLDRKIKSDFQLAPTSPVLLILHGKHHWATQKNLLSRITAKVASVDQVAKVTSLANLEIAFKNSSEIRTGTVYDILSVKNRSEKLRNNNLITPQLLSENGLSTLVLIEPKDKDSLTIESLEENLNLKLKNEKGLQDYQITGVPIVQTQTAHKIRTEVSKYFLMCIFAFTLLLVAFYRNWQILAFGVFGLIYVNVICLAGLAIFKVPMTALLSTLPILISISFISLLVHTLHLWAEKRATMSGEKFQGLKKQSVLCLGEIFNSNLLSTLTSVIGILALATSVIPAIQSYAITMSMAIIGCFILTHLLFYLLLPVLRPQLREWNMDKAWWGSWILQHRSYVLVIVLGFTFFLGAQAPHINFSSRLFDDLPKNSSARKGMDWIDHHLGGTIPLNISIQLNEKNSWHQTSMASKLRRAVDEIRRSGEIPSVMAYTDLIPAVGEASTAEAIFLFSLAANDPLKQFISSSGRNARVQVRLPDSESEMVMKYRKHIRAILEKEFPTAEILEGGIAVVSHSLNQEVARDLVFGFFHSLAIIGVFLVLFFRSFAWALVAVLPNLLPPLALAGLLGLLQTPTKPAVALIFSIALGLTFNNTVYLLLRMKRLRKESGSKSLPITRALSVEGHPCLTESIVTLLGFALFLSSDFRLNQTFGSYMVLSIFAGAIADLFFLPSLIKSFPILLNFSIRRSAMSTAQISKTFVVIFLLSMLVPQISRGDEALEILRSLRSQLETKSDRAIIDIKTTEANGDSKSRSFQIKTLKDKDSFRAKLRVLEPADVRNTSILAQKVKGKNEQWIYLPSQQQTRKIISTEKKSIGIMGSEFSSEDLDWSALKSAKAKIIEKTSQKTIMVVEAKSANYSQARIYLSGPRMVPEKIEYFKKNTLVRTVSFTNYLLFGKKTLRPKSILVKNHLTQRQSQVRLNQIEVNPSLKLADFSLSSLSRGF